MGSLAFILLMVMNNVFIQEWFFGMSLPSRVSVIYSVLSIIWHDYVCAREREAGREGERGGEKENGERERGRGDREGERRKERERETDRQRQRQRETVCVCGGVRVYVCV